MRLEVIYDGKVLKDATIREQQHHGYMEIEIHQPGENRRIDLLYGACRRELDGSITYLNRRDDNKTPTMSVRLVVESPSDEDSTVSE